LLNIFISWAKLPISDRWHKYFARVQNSCIYFCRDVTSNEF